MKLHGLFIGIDRYASPGINWLSCARRDAVALCSLFSDNMPGDLVLLTDSDATRKRINSELEKLASCDSDDIVVFAFSGHGTETHEIVPFDADRTSLSTTTLPLSELAERFTKILAKNFIGILDCCFSGGMGAKAIQVDLGMRSIDSPTQLLNELSGDGRIILTASLATERAWEHQKLGHSLLTHFLLEALQGAEEVRKNGKVGIYRLLEYVTTMVIDSANQFGEKQHPMLLGQIKEEILFPIFRPGEQFKKAFPERTKQNVTPDLQSLSAFGFPDFLISAWGNASITILNNLQMDAINEFRVLNGEHLVVSAPTSSGKTLIGELASLLEIVNRKRAIFLLPLKALVNDKFRQFEETYGPFGVRTIRATGESTSDDILPLMRGQYDICLMTYEKFAAIVLGSPYILDQVGTIVIDEVQMIADNSRGTNLEFILTLLRIRRKQGIEPQVIALSAVIGSTNGLERWLGARLLKRLERPVPIDEGVVSLNGTFRYVESDTGMERTRTVTQTQHRKGSGQDIIIPLVRTLVSEGRSVLVFRETRSEAQACAMYLARELGLPPAQDAIAALSVADPSVSSQKLHEALCAGVAFHISDLDAEERLNIEKQFRTPRSGLKVIVATTTLAMGVNTPAEAVIIAGLSHPGDQPYSIAEYKNIVGRAGRLGYASRGTSFVVALDHAEEYSIWQNYVLGEPEDLQSRFFSPNTDPRSLILRIFAAIRSMRGLSELQVIEFIGESFGSFQERLRNPSWLYDTGKITGAMDQLHSHGLIELDESGFYHSTPLGRLAGESGLEVESVVRIVRALHGVEKSEISDPVLIALAQLTVEVEQVYFPLNRRSTQKEPQTWMSEIRNQRIPAQIQNSFNQNVECLADVTLRAKKTVACLLWITDRPLVEIENTLMQFDRRNTAAGSIRGVSARVCDMLPTISKIAELLNSGLVLGNRIERLLVRLELGIPGAVVDLGRLFGRTLSRGDYLSLSANQVLTRDQFEASSDDILLPLLGNSVEKLTVARKKIEDQTEKEKFETINPILEVYME